MRHPFLFTFAAALLAGPCTGIAAAADAAPAGHTAEVNVFVGTGGDGHTFPGAAVPFGMVQLSPDTRQAHFRQGYPWAAGYRYEDDSILGFSHTHFSGAGHSDLGDVLLMPTSNEMKFEAGYPERAHSGYRSRFSHQDEHAEPGYYAVRLIDNQVDVELTASDRDGDAPLLVKVALSGVSEQGALANLAEMPGWDFDAARARAHEAWEGALSALDIQAPPAMKHELYTALYHAMISPSLFMDLDGQ